MFVEGKRTEEQYLTIFRREYRDVKVEIDKTRGVPMTLVRSAIDAKKRGETEEKRGRGAAHDDVWCVFDRDEHPDVDEAIRLAGEQGIRVAFSNPCLELWFVLHFEDQTAFIERGAAQRHSETLLECKKNLSVTAGLELRARYDDARRRAVLLAEMHIANGSPVNENPSSGMWQLIDRIREP